MIKAEFHIHTRYSKDSILNKYFILLMCKIRNIKLLAITDHNEIKGAIKYKKFLKKFNIDVIVGEEIMTKSGEIIGLFLNKKIIENLSVEETIRKIKEQNGLIYLPHPYDEKRFKTVLESKMQEKYKNEFDFIEIYNGRNIKEDFAIKQQEIQKKLGINAIIGGDSHTFLEIGRNYIEMNYEGKDTLIENMKNANFHKAKCLKISHKITKLVVITKMIAKGDFNELFRIFIRKCRRKDKRTI